MTTEEKKVIDKIHDMFGYTWFTSRMVKVKLDVLGQMEKKNLLESGRAVAGGATIFRIKP